MFSLYVIGIQKMLVLLLFRYYHSSTVGDTCIKQIDQSLSSEWGSKMIGANDRRRHNQLMTVPSAKFLLAGVGTLSHPQYNDNPYNIHDVSRM